MMKTYFTGKSESKIPKILTLQQQFLSKTNSLKCRKFWESFGNPSSLWYLKTSFCFPSEKRACWRFIPSHWLSGKSWRWGLWPEFGWHGDRWFLLVSLVLAFWSQRQELKSWRARRWRGIKGANQRWRDSRKWDDNKLIVAEESEERERERDEWMRELKESSAADWFTALSPHNTYTAYSVGLLHGVTGLIVLPEITDRKH